MNPRITVRNIASPIAWGAPQPGMAFHHIIPFSVLREVWNRLVDRHIETQFPEARVAIRQYLLLCDGKIPGIDALVDRIRSENTAQRRASHHNLQPLDVAEAHRLSTAAVWPAWDVVEGPQRRSDDPGDRYLDRFTSGLTLDESVRMRAIELLFHDFERFVHAGPAPGPDTLRTLAGAVSNARAVLACDTPIRYRPEMWVKDGPSAWRKRRDGERFGR